MTRIRISIGDIEIEYEGEQSFIDDSLLAFAEQVIALRAPAAAVAVPSESNSAATVRSMLSTNTIAQTLSSKTGSDLALAAIAKINIVKAQPTAPRQDILDEMKQATTYYKETYAGNLTSYLDTLVRAKRINLVSRGTYALAASERGRLENALSNDS